MACKRNTGRVEKMKRITIFAVIMAMFACALTGCSSGNEEKKVQEDVVAEQMENLKEETEAAAEAEEESVLVEKTVEAILALDTCGSEAIAEIMSELPDNSEYPDIYVVSAEQYMSVGAYENALFVLEVGAEITGEEMLLDIRQGMGEGVGLLEGEESVSSEDVEEEKEVEPEVVAGQKVFDGKYGKYLLTYDPEKIEMKSGAKPLESIGELRASVDFRMEHDYVSAQEYIDEYVEFLKVIDEQEDIERYDEINVSPITQAQIGNVTVEKFSIQIVGMNKGVEETLDNSYAFIDLGTGDCLIITDYYYDKNAEVTGVDFLNLLNWVILNLEVME